MLWMSISCLRIRSSRRSSGPSNAGKWMRYGDAISAYLTHVGRFPKQNVTPDSRLFPGGDSKATIVEFPDALLEELMARAHRHLARKVRLPLRRQTGEN